MAVSEQGFGNAAALKTVADAGIVDAVSKHLI
jgi:hypothetical protein